MKIVVGTDFNPLATAALRFAAAIATRIGAELIVVYADTFEPPAEFTATQLPRIAETIRRSKNRTREELEAYIAKHVPNGVPWKAVVADGLPATSIAAIAAAEGAEFIAVGTHGRGGLQRFVIGSVAEAVIREARVPVLTVHSTVVPSNVRRVLSAAPARLTEALRAEVTVLEDADDPLQKADSGDYDLIVVGAGQAIARDVARHARTPVLTVGRTAGEA